MWGRRGRWPLGRVPRPAAHLAAPRAAEAENALERWRLGAVRVADRSWAEGRPRSGPAHTVRWEAAPPAAPGYLLSVPAAPEQCARVCGPRQRRRGPWRPRALGVAAAAGGSRCRQPRPLQGPAAAPHGPQTRGQQQQRRVAASLVAWRPRAAVWASSRVSGAADGSGCRRAPSSRTSPAHSAARLVCAEKGVKEPGACTRGQGRGWRPPPAGRRGPSRAGGETR